MIPYVLFHSFDVFTIFYNVENSENKENPGMSRCVQTISCHICLYHGISCHVSLYHGIIYLFVLWYHIYLSTWCLLVRHGIMHLCVITLVLFSSPDFSTPASPLSALFPPAPDEGAECFGELDPMPVWDWSTTWVEEMEAQYRAQYTSQADAPPACNTWGHCRADRHCEDRRATGGGRV